MRVLRRHVRPSREREERRYLIAAALAVIGIAVVAYLAFSKQLPFQSPYEIRGEFNGVAQLRSGSAVRMSGVTIGTVTDIGLGPRHDSLVTMRIDDRHVPIRDDATLSILPRTTLEGNDYVLVNPGTPGARVLRSGATIPASQTSHEVQLDQVLDVLTLPTRQALTSTIGNLAQGLGGGGLTSSQPTTGAQALQNAARELAGALNSVTIVANAAQGTQPGDLSRAIGSTGQFSSQLAADPGALADVVTNFDRVSGALAAEDQSLASSVAQFDRLTQSAPANLVSIDRALPPLTRFANDLRPALQVAPPQLAAFSQLLDQLQAVAQPDQLPRLLTFLRPVTANLPSLERKLLQLFPLVTPVSKCVSRNIVPTLDKTLSDGATSSGRPAWQDLVHAAANLAATAAGFDGNGTTLRLGLTEGDQAVTALIPGLGNIVGISPKIEGVRPQWLGYGVTPPFRPDEPCDQQPLPNMNADSAGPPANFRYSAVPPLSPTNLGIARGMAGPQSALQSLLQSLLRQLQLPAHTRRGARSGAARPSTASPQQVQPQRATAAGRPAGGPPAPSATSAAGSPQAPSGQSNGPLQAVQQLLGSLLSGGRP